MEEGETSLREVLCRVARELTRLHRSGLAIEDVVGNQIRTGRLPEGAMHLSLQRLDLLVQSLEGVAIFVAHLAEEVDTARAVDASDAARRVPIRDLARALAQSDHLAGEEEDTGGQVHLF